MRQRITQFISPEVWRFALVTVVEPRQHFARFDRRDVSAMVRPRGVV